MQQSEQQSTILKSLSIVKDKAILLHQLKQTKEKENSLSNQIKKSFPISKIKNYSVLHNRPHKWGDWEKIKFINPDGFFVNSNDEIGYYTKFRIFTHFQIIEELNYFQDMQELQLFDKPTFDSTFNDNFIYLYMTYPEEYGDDDSVYEFAIVLIPKSDYNIS